MSTFNRRDWLKASGLLGTTALIQGFNSIENPEIPITTTGKDGSIQLNFNENPFGPSDKVRKSIIDSLDYACRYPDQFLRELADLIAEKEGVDRNHIVITGGSTEGLKITGAAYGLYGGEIIAARPTFNAMMDHASHFGATVNWVDVKDDMCIDLQEMERRISSKTRLIFLCNPNNPTSTIAGADELKKFCEYASSRALVFSDEAYYDYIEEKDYPSMISFVKEGRNVVVSRTFSKVYGLAGLRIGYLIARPDIATTLKDQVVAFTNVPALRAAVAALKDGEFYQYSLEQNRKAKALITNTLDELDLKYAPSQTNFVFFRSGIHIDEFQEHFAKENIRIGRPFPPFYDWCRISTGKLSEVKAFCKVLKSIYS